MGPSQRQLCAQRGSVATSSNAGPFESSARVRCWRNLHKTVRAKTARALALELFPHARDRQRPRAPAVGLSQRWPRDGTRFSGDVRKRRAFQKSRARTLPARSSQDRPSQTARTLALELFPRVRDRRRWPRDTTRFGGNVLERRAFRKSCARTLPVRSSQNRTGRDTGAIADVRRQRRTPDESWRQHPPHRRRCRPPPLPAPPAQTPRCAIPPVLHSADAPGRCSGRARRVVLPRTDVETSMLRDVHVKGTPPKDA